MTLLSIACQAPLSTEFSRQEYWSRLPCPSPGESSWPKDRPQVSCIAGRFITVWATWEEVVVTGGWGLQKVVVVESEGQWGEAWGLQHRSLEPWSWGPVPQEALWLRWIPVLHPSQTDTFPSIYWIFKKLFWIIKVYFSVLHLGRHRKGFILGGFLHFCALKENVLSQSCLF